MDTLVDGHDLCPDNRILASKDVEAEPRRRWNAINLCDIFCHDMRRQGLMTIENR
jgi:hypothetical protein